jgi:hypothetical protein
MNRDEEARLDNLADRLDALVDRLESLVDVISERGALVGREDAPTSGERPQGT